MSKFNFGEIILIKFPFTDSKDFKIRPALIIADFDDNDFIVCRITSVIYKTNFDVLIKQFEEFGLLKKSVIRVHKLATLEKKLFYKKLGKLNDFYLEIVKEKYGLILK